MLRYIGLRLAWVIPQLLVVTAIGFVIVRLLPGDPVYVQAGPFATPEDVARIAAHMGLDKPIWLQFVRYVNDLLKGDLGRSWVTMNPVAADLKLRISATLELITYTLIVASIVGVVLGILSSHSPNKLWSRVVYGYGLLAGSMVTFWWGLVFILLFYYIFSIFPAPMGRISSGITPPSFITGIYTIDSLLTGNWAALQSALYHLALPVLSFAFCLCPAILKMTRQTMSHVLEMEFMTYARACGLRGSTLFRYSLRNCLAPVITIMGILFGIELGGAVLVEVIFAWGGVGQYAVQAITASDYAAVSAVVLVFTAFCMVIFLAMDILYFAIDPRIKM